MVNKKILLLLIAITPLIPCFAEDQSVNVPNKYSFTNDFKKLVTGYATAAIGLKIFGKSLKNADRIVNSLELESKLYGRLKKTSKLFNLHQKTHVLPTFLPKSSQFCLKSSQLCESALKSIVDLVVLPPHLIRQYLKTLSQIDPIKLEKKQAEKLIDFRFYPRIGTISIPAFRASTSFGLPLLCMYGYKKSKDFLHKTK